MHSTSPGTFPHHKLDAWHAAVEVAIVGRDLAARFPRGERDLADQLKRACTAPALLIAEGANRRSSGEKCQRFTEARGECGEVASAAELAAALGIVEQAQAQKLVVLASRVAAMMTRLIQRFGS